MIPGMSGTSSCRCLQCLYDRSTETYYPSGSTNYDPCSRAYEREPKPQPNNKKEKPWHKFTKRRLDGRYCR